MSEESPTECPHQQVVDDVAGEEEPVDSSPVLVAEGLGGDGRLGGVGAGEGEVDGPYEGREGNLSTERGDRQQ